MSFKTPILCDRRVYDKRGYWKNPNQDVEEPFFYFIKGQPTLVSEYKNGREEITQEITIVVFGGKPFAPYDKIKLATGETFVIQPNIRYNYFEPNILIRDMVKPIIENVEMDIR